MFYEELSEVLKEDVKFNSTNLLQKIQDRPVKLHQWLFRLRTMQQEYHQLVDSKESLLCDIVTELEDTEKTMIVSKQSTIKRAEKDPKYKKLLKKINELELDIEFAQQCVDTIKWIGQDHERMIKMMQMEKL